MPRAPQTGWHPENVTRYRRKSFSEVEAMVFDGSRTSCNAIDTWLRSRNFIGPVRYDPHGLMWIGVPGDALKLMGGQYLLIDELGELAAMDSDRFEFDWAPVEEKT